MNLDVITLKEHKKWDEIVSLFSKADVYYQRGYVQAFKVHGDGEPLLFYFYDDSTNNKAINVVMKRDISKDIRFAGIIEPNTYFDFVTPYGYGGLICECIECNGDFLKTVNVTYVDYCYENNIVSEFVRFHPNIENGPKAEMVYDIVKLGETVCIDLKDKETIWSNIISKNRNVIRKAQKSSVKIEHGMSKRLMQHFIELYNLTMERDNATEYYYFKNEFYDSILNDLKNNATIFYATWQNQIIAASIILFSGDRMHYHLSASNAEFRRLAPTNLLLYEAAIWGFEKGFKTFHLGGGLGSKEDNLYKFKKAFNRNENTQFWIGKKIFNLDIYKELVEIRKQENDFDENTRFFPKYRG